jgi:hypothetical protein
MIGVLMKKILLSMAIVATLSACSTQTAFVHERGGELKKSEMQTFFVSGLGQTQTVKANEVCGSSEKVAKVERVFTPLNWLLGALTYGIYTPYEAKVYCTQ